MVRKDGVKLLSAWMAIVLAALPILTPSLFTASSWKTSLFFVSFSQIHVKNVHKCVDSRLVSSTLLNKSFMDCSHRFLNILHIHHKGLQLFNKTCSPTKNGSTPPLLHTSHQLQPLLHRHSVRGRVHLFLLHHYLAKCPLLAALHEIDRKPHALLALIHAPSLKKLCNGRHANTFSTRSFEIWAAGMGAFDSQVWCPLGISSQNKTCK